MNYHWCIFIAILFCGWFGYCIFSALWAEFITPILVFLSECFFWILVLLYFCSLSVGKEFFTGKLQDNFIYLYAAILIFSSLKKTWQIFQQRQRR